MTAVGRNDPCHCGSGKKFKKCHGAHGDPRRAAGAQNERASTQIGSYAPSRREKRRVPQNEEEFRGYVEEIDADLATRQVAIPARPLAAILEAAFDQGIEDASLLTIDGEPARDVYQGDDLARRIVRWYEASYGSRLRIDMSPGSTVVILHGETWEYRFPFGDHATLFFARDLVEGPAMFLETNGRAWLPPSDPRRSAWPNPPLDVLAGVVGLPPSLIARLNDAELTQVVELYYTDWLAIRWLNRARYHDLVSSAIGDFRAAVHHMVSRPPSLGQARWSAQQGVEKVLKSCLAHSRGDYPKKGPDAHNLQRLGELVGAAGGPSFPGLLFEEINCKPGVRYDEEPTGDNRDVVRRFRIALSTAGALAAYLCQRHPLPVDSDSGAKDPTNGVRDLMAQLIERSGLPPDPAS